MFKYIYIGYTYDYYNFIYRNIASKYNDVFFCQPPMCGRSKLKKVFHYCLSKAKLKPFAELYNRLFIDKELNNEISENDTALPQIT